MAIVRTVLHYSGFGEEGTVSWNVSTDGASPSETDLASYLNDLDDHFNNDETPAVWTDFTKILSGAQTFDSLAAYSYASPAATRADDLAVLSVDHVGSASIVHPLQVAIVASLRTNRAGRKYRGRQFYPGHCVAVDADGQATAAELARMGTLASVSGTTVETACRSAFGDTSRWAVWSRSGNSATAIQTVILNSRLDIQRRRAASQVAERQNSYPVGV